MTRGFRLVPLFCGLLCTLCLLGTLCVLNSASFVYYPGSTATDPSQAASLSP